MKTHNSNSFSLNTNFGFTLRVGGFTLAETLVAVSIIAILIVSTLVGGINVLNRSRAQATAQQIKEIEAAVKVYFLDTHSFPRTLTLGNADNPALNPLLTDQGVPGWNGPYVRENMVITHHWGGAVRWLNEDTDGDLSSEENNFDSDNTTADFFIMLDDDPSSGALNSGIIPSNILLLIDEILDDGNLTSGEIRGNGKNGVCQGGTGGPEMFVAACGELMIRVRPAGI